MKAISADPSAQSPSLSRIVKLTALFWAFSYVLLTIRGAIMLDDWGRLLDDNRILAVTVGAGAYWLVLRQLDAGHRITLRAALVWIVGASLAVMIVRVTIDELMFDVPQGIGLNLLWSLTWSAYFGLWVMGSLAFAPRAAIVPSPAKAVERPAVQSGEANLDTFELMAALLIAETASLSSADRAELAARVLSLGGYDSVDGTAADNERARLALRLAARLSAGG